MANRGATAERGERFVTVGTAVHVRRSDELHDRLDAALAGVARLIDELADLDEATAFGELGTPAADIRGVGARRCGSVSAHLAHLDDRLAVRAATELLESGAHLYDAVSTVSRWLEQHQGFRRPEAQRLVRVARTLQRLPALAFPFANGEIRLGHLDAVARIVPSRVTGDELDAMWAALAECQSELVEAAVNTPVRRFERFCGRVRERLDVDGPAGRSAEPSRVWLHPTFNGRWSLTGDLSADDGAVLAAFLEQRTRRDLRTRCDQAPGTETSAAAEPDEAPAMMADVRAQALLGLCRDGAGARSPGRIALNLHIDLDELRAPEGFPARAWTGAGSDITEESLWGLLAGADIRPVFCRGGTPLSYGRTRRLAPDILKMILAYRDRECMVGLCDVPHTWLDAHHLTHWEHGGATDSTDMRCPCGFHHRGHHRGRWKIVADEATGEIQTWRPDGSMIDVRPRWVGDRRATHPEAVAIRRRIDDLAARRRRRRRAT